MDYSTAKTSVKTAEHCLIRCKSNSRCSFWDFGNGWCRLRSSPGSAGPIPASGYTSGPKSCKLGSSSGTNKTRKINHFSIT